MTGKMTAEGGYTLLELLVAVVILAVGLLGMAALQGVAMQGNHLGGANTEATALAMAQIETMREQPYDFRVPDDPELNLGPRQNFRRETVVQFDTPELDSKTVTVTVSWNAPAAHSVRVQTVIVNPNPN